MTKVNGYGMRLGCTPMVVDIHTMALLPTVRLFTTPCTPVYAQANLFVDSFDCKKERRCRAQCEDSENQDVRSEADVSEELLKGIQLKQSGHGVTGARGHTLNIIGAAPQRSALSERFT